ncbi:hypothetical protein GIY23_06330 [Allosaccharopolyspora coralli]|uniref:Uncharacterized protein n=1 Tax=Allosaccharopolyspora coralli TaxID=2665642 RepID=A0A5Q3QCD8_9PSEU|nr:hypothetical protein [Allosaccharopolyspora coralli]QGK69199.1 hypothetical protein GIY23_06330 [Allosaccharopolyspora coralli]
MTQTRGATSVESPGRSGIRGKTIALGLVVLGVALLHYGWFLDSRGHGGPVNGTGEVTVCDSNWRYLGVLQTCEVRLPDSALTLAVPRHVLAVAFAITVSALWFGSAHLVHGFFVAGAESTAPPTGVATVESQPATATRGCWVWCGHATRSSSTTVAAGSSTRSTTRR